LRNAAKASGPPLLFGLRLWASVCLYIAFWLELDNAFWAGISAAIVCLPHLGASLRKGSVSDTLLYRARMAGNGATRTFCKVRYPVAMGWQGDLEEAVLKKLN
jgi:Fusaric acid resistance protein family